MKCLHTCGAQLGVEVHGTIAGAGGHGGYVVYNKLRPKCSTTTRCFGKTYPDAPASPPGAQGFYYPGTLRPAALHDYHGSLELTPYLSSEQLTMVRAASL